MTFDELLKNYREVFCLSEREKGENFERLMKNFLLTYSIYRGKFSDVWLWKNFPYKNQLGGKDLGIDIVAKNFDDEFFAVQCKFYSEDSIIDKSAVDSFISTSARKFLTVSKKIFRRAFGFLPLKNILPTLAKLLKINRPKFKL